MSNAAEMAGSACAHPAVAAGLPCASPHSTASSAQSEWAHTAIVDRLAVLRKARHRMAADAERFAAAISPALPRTGADTLTAELMPLLDACKFLERNAARVLAPRTLGRRGRPFWLRGVQAEVHRAALGEVLVIGPGNFPLLLPGVQVLQALAAGNSVVWKPAPDSRAVALLVAQALRDGGLPAGLLTVTDDSVEAAQAALAAHPDKVIFTGSHATGCAVLGELARSATPAVMELSGADAVVVLGGADLERTAKAIAFGLRLNGAQVCMSPRRLLAERDTLARLLPLLERELASVPAVTLPRHTGETLQSLAQEAESNGAVLHGAVTPEAQRPLLILHAQAHMRIACADIFAPVLSVIELRSLQSAPATLAHCAYGLTVSVFCSRKEEDAARAIASEVRAGTVLINDLIAPTADPRVPFAGRGASGFGATRGTEGLLEMTVPKVLLLRRGGSMRHMDATNEDDTPLLANLLRAAHAGTWRERWQAVVQVTRLGRARNADANAQESSTTAGNR